MSIKIVTDSTCDLPKHIIEQNDITVIPLLIHAGGKTLRDGIDLSRREFFEQLPGFKPHATTGTPGPEIFKQVYEKLASEGASGIISIHISRKLSAILDVAQMAANEISHIPVTVFDSRQLSMGTGFEALTAARAAANGKSMGEILEMLEEQIMRTHVFAALDTLEFLRRSGRMNIALAAIGSILRIKPFLKMYNGEPTAERVRTRHAAMNRLVELLKQYHPYEKVALLHSGAADRAKALLQEVRSLLPPGEIWIEEINPAIGAHIGPGVIGFACISQQK